MTLRDWASTDWPTIVVTTTPPEPSSSTVVTTPVSLDPMEEFDQMLCEDTQTEAPLRDDQEMTPKEVAEVGDLSPAFPESATGDSILDSLNQQFV